MTLHPYRSPSPPRAPVAALSWLARNGAAVVLLGVVSVVACAHARRAVIAATPTAPRSEGVACPAVPWRCSAGVPEHCQSRDGESRWWPLHPLGDDGRPAPCSHACVLSGDPVVAHCAAEVTP